jgi:hypothetical protein
MDKNVPRLRLGSLQGKPRWAAGGRRWGHTVARRGKPADVVRTMRTLGGGGLSVGVTGRQVLGAGHGRLMRSHGDRAHDLDSPLEPCRRKQSDAARD